MPQTWVTNMDLEFAIRLLISCVCGGAIGIERRHRHKEAGVKTHMIVAVGAALFVIISKYAFSDMLCFNGVRADPGRIASNVVTGVSFLGAGMISIRGDIVLGLTTAAGIWVTASIGMAIGAGLYILGISGTILIIIVQCILHFGKGHGIDKLVSSKIVVQMEEDTESFIQLRKMMERKKIRICGMKMKRHRDHSITYTMDVHMPGTLKAEDVLEFLKENSNIKSIGI